MTDYKDNRRTIILPCRVGDNIYFFDDTGRIYDTFVNSFVIDSEGIHVKCGGSESGIKSGFKESEIGVSYFKTRIDAENEVKSRKQARAIMCAECRFCSNCQILRKQSSIKTMCNDFRGKR